MARRFHQLTAPFVLLTTLLGSLAGCKSAPPRPLPLPLQIASPVEGESLAYIFRPRLDNVGVDDHPTLVIDGQKIAMLRKADYTIVSLKPGVHHFELLALEGEDADWNMKQEVQTGAGQAYFLAVWHSDQANDNYTHFSVIGNKNQTLFGSLALSLGQAIVQGHRGEVASVYFEPVEQEMAAQALSDLKPVAAQANHLTPPIAGEILK